MRRSPVHEARVKSARIVRSNCWRPLLEALEDRCLPSTVTVTSTADDGAGSLRAALAQSKDGDLISFALPDHSTIQLTSGFLMVASNVTVSGPGAEQLTVRGDANHAVFFVSCFGHASIFGLTMTGGREGAGGGIFMYRTSLTVSGCVVTGNTGLVQGGGIYQYQGSLAIDHSVISTNSSPDGGGIYENNLADSLTITDSVIDGNTVSGIQDETDGGGIDSRSSLFVRRTTVSNNSAGGSYDASGGGIAAFGVATLVDCTIAGNTAEGGAGGVGVGGGIYSQNTVTVVSSSLNGNNAIGGDSNTGNGGLGEGGGLFTTGVATLTNSTIADNTARAGWSQTADGGDAFGGGALFGSDGNVVTNCTVAFNSVLAGIGAPGFNNATCNGGGASFHANAAAATVVNSIFAENTADLNPEDLSGLPTVRYCLLSSTTDNGVINGSDGNIVTGNADLGELRNNGGPTPTLALLAGSPAIDNGTNDGVTYSTDQRGYDRFAHGVTDIGAFESQYVPLLATGADAGGTPEVKVYEAATGKVRFDFNAFDAGFTGGVRVALGDVNGDGVPDIIAGAGPGGGPQVNVYDGATGNLITAFFAFNPAFTGGVFVAAGDMDRDGFADLVVGKDADSGPGVAIYSGKDASNNVKTLLVAFAAFDPSFTGGVRVAVGDVNGNGFADVIAGKGPGAAPRVRVFDGFLIFNSQQKELYNFYAFAPSFTGGVTVAAGDTNGDGLPDIVVGKGPGAAPRVSVFNGPDGSLLATFLAYDPRFGGGVRVAVEDLDGDGRADIITGAGPGGGPHVRAFDGTGQPLADAFDSFFAYDPSFTGGVFVGGA